MIFENAFSEVLDLHSKDFDLEFDSISSVMGIDLMGTEYDDLQRFIAIMQDDSFIEILDEALGDSVILPNGFFSPSCLFLK